MGKYLEKFRGTINQRQSDQILRLLNKQRTQGQVRTVEEFNRRLDTLIRELTGTVLQPSLKLFLAAESEFTSSEQFNFMLDRVQDDLEAAFEEAVNISEVQNSHEALVRDVILKNLRAGVAELDSKTTLYEFLNKDSHGFDSNVFSTFRESKEERTQRGAIDTSYLFVDPRTKELFPSSQDATVELIGERLTLATANRNYHQAHSIRQVFDATSPQTDKIVTPPGMALENIIDDTVGTYWTQSWLFTTAQKYIKAKLEVDLGVAREINFIEIEPVTSTGFFLEAIHYLDGSGVFQSLAIPEHFLSGPAGLRVSKFLARVLVFTFRNENGALTSFEYTNQDTLLGQSQIKADVGILAPNKEAIASTMDSIVASQAIKTLAGYQTPVKETYTGFEFKIGFDNIRIGLVDYEDTSIYVATPMNGSSTAILGLRTAESRPYIEAGVIRFTETAYNEDRLFLASIEHWITRQDFNTEGVMVRTTSFPILPMGTGRVIHERLILTDKSSITLSNNDIGDLMFYTTYSPLNPGLDGNVIVYRNGVVIPNQDDSLAPSNGWISSDSIIDGGGPISIKTPNIGQPMRFRIRIFGGLPGDIYTVSYTPMVSTVQVVPKPPYAEILFKGGIQVVDLVGDLSARRIEGHAILIDAIGGSDTAATSKYYYSIVLRQNAADATISPAVEEYSFFAGQRDSSKFAGE